ncbi:thiamine phosphate synthase [Galbibacter mesophilus]|uniref:thiamine phosphate synthase n=1 Tax=Galbibacter mesophilus TaxID=379069 RepID=UPI00191E8954|nr:thiamine phosphate synthase [Galbibacter mesophilus]MCM5662062.1 thiamine phosphate synthase [Galbibacter mesophilus]
MLIIITKEENTENEVTVLKSLFENGLQTLHVRKPFMSKTDLEKWLLNFSEMHHRKMMLHQHHELCETFKIKGVHLTKKQRSTLENRKVYIEKFQKEGKMVSTGFHTVTELKQEGTLYDYCFLSPIFNSISKENYAGKQFSVNGLQQKIVALGGIDNSKITEVKKLGFSGVAVLGHIWKSDNPLENFLLMKEKYKKIYE